MPQVIPLLLLPLRPKKTRPTDCTSAGIVIMAVERRDRDRDKVEEKRQAEQASSSSGVGTCVSLTFRARGGRARGGGGSHKAGADRLHELTGPILPPGWQLFRLETDTLQHSEVVWLLLFLLFWCPCLCSLEGMRISLEDFLHKCI